MNKKERLLKIITNETLDATYAMPIVTPSVYATLFSQKAEAHSLKLEDEVEFSKALILKECEDLVKIRDSNNKNTVKLSNSTSKAIDAIKQNDEASLKVVLKETEALRKELEELKESIYKDELTNAFNRKYLKDTYLQKNSDKFSKNGVLCIIDLNFFKEINDKYGHPVGDKVLVFIANNLKKTGADIIRFGGDEFLIMFDKSTSVNKAKELVENVHDDMTSKKLKSKSGEFRVTFSLGICHYNKDDEFSHVLDIADTQMYKNKQKIKKVSSDI